MLDERVSNWLLPLGDDSPAGPNLEYDPEFLQLETASRAQPEQEFSNSDAGTKITIEGQGPDWVEVRRVSESLLGRTRDLRVAVYYTRAMLRLDGFSGVAIGLSLIHGLLEQLWEHVHPQLDSEDDNDPTMRVNALAPLVSTDAVLDDLRSAWVFRSRQVGALSVRDIEVAQGRLPLRPGDTAYSESQVSGLLSEAVAQDASLGEQAKECARIVSSLSDLLQERIGASLTLDFKPLQTILQCVLRAFQLVQPSIGGAAEAPVAEVLAEHEASGSAVAMPSARPGTISSRQDVVSTLDQLIQYLERNEPTNPAQLLLRRAQRVMHMSFLEAIDELAPDGLQQAERSVGGSLGRAQE